jgi:hypothetical protein
VLGDTTSEGVDPVVVAMFVVFGAAMAMGAWWIARDIRRHGGRPGWAVFWWVTVVMWPFAIYLIGFYRGRSQSEVGRRA